MTFITPFVKQHPFIVWLLTLCLLFFVTYGILRECTSPYTTKKVESWLPQLLGLTTLFVFDYLYSRMIKRLQVKVGENKHDIPQSKCF